MMLIIVMIISSCRSLVHAGVQVLLVIYIFNLYIDLQRGGNSRLLAVIWPCDVGAYVGGDGGRRCRL